MQILLGSLPNDQAEALGSMHRILENYFAHIPCHTLARSLFNATAGSSIFEDYGIDSQSEQVALFAARKYGGGTLRRATP